jgi:hypothetical protein
MAEPTDPGRVTPAIDAEREALLMTLVDHGVQFVVIGGAGIQPHGRPYDTLDIDLTPDDEPLPPIIRRWRVISVRTSPNIRLGLRVVGRPRGEIGSTSGPRTVSASEARLEELAALGLRPPPPTARAARWDARTPASVGPDIVLWVRRDLLAGSARAAGGPVASGGIHDR